MHANRIGLAAATISVALAFGLPAPATLDTASSSEVDGVLKTLQTVLEKPSKGTFNLKLNGQSIMLTTSPVDFRLSSLLSTRAPLEPINRWNAQHRYARAYVDGQGTHLEADLDVAGGVTRRSAQVFLHRFGTMARQFAAEFANLAPAAVTSNKTKLSLPHGEFGLWFDPKQWQQGESKEGGVSLRQLQGDGYALIFTDPVGGANALDALKDSILANFKKNLPEMKLTLDEKRTVSRHEGNLLRLEGTVNGAAIRYLTFSYTRPSATIHLVTYSGAETFDKNKAAFMALIDGLEITDPAVDVSSADGRITLPSGKAFIDFDKTAWQLLPSAQQGRYMLKSSAGEAYALVIWEGLAFPLENLPKMGFANLQQQDGGAKITAEKWLTVNGQELVQMNVEATIRGLGISYRNYYFSSKAAGSIQILTWATQAEITKYEAVLAEFPKGFHLTE